MKSLRVEHDFKTRAIVFRRFDVVVIEPGADDVVGGLQRRKVRFEAAEDRAVALGAQMIDASARAAPASRCGSRRPTRRWRHRPRAGTCSRSSWRATCSLGRGALVMRTTVAPSRPRPHQRVAGVRMKPQGRCARRPRRRTAARHSRVRAWRISRSAGAMRLSSRTFFAALRRSGMAAAATRAYRMKRKERKSAGRQQGARALVNARFGRVGRHALQRLGTHRARRREQEALPETDVVVEKVDDRRFGLDPLGDQVDAGARQQVGEVFRIDVGVRRLRPC